MREFRVGDKVHNKVLGAGIVLEVFLLYCKVQFEKLKTERFINKEKLNKED